MVVAKLVCDKIPYSLPRGEHKAYNLRAFFGVPDSKHLYHESCDGGDDTVIEGNVPIFVEDGDRFYSVHKKINNS